MVVNALSTSPERYPKLPKDDIICWCEFEQYDTDNEILGLNIHQTWVMGDYFEQS